MIRHPFPITILAIAVILIQGCSSDGLSIPPLRSDEGSLTIGANPNQASGVAANSAVTDIRNRPRYLEGEVLIVLKDGIDPGGVYPLAKSFGLSLKKEIRLKWATVYRMSIVNGEPVESMVSKLKARPEVRYVEPNYIYYSCSVPYYPNDPVFDWPAEPDGDPWDDMYDQWGPNVLGASLVWPTGKGDPNVVIAVLDTGCRWTHEDLANQVWINEDEIPDNGIDDDNNGYIDDWHGYDFDQGDNDPSDDWGHGTACSGVVAAEQDNGVGCTGIAPGCKVMVLRANMMIGDPYTTTVIEGTQYAYDNGATAVSMSFRSYDESEIMHQTFIAVWDDGNGILPIGAAGNEDSPNDCWPADWPEVFEIGATCSFYNSGERRDVTRLNSTDFGWGSNWGPHLGVMAPGALYITTNSWSDDSYYEGGPNGFGGTSNATPCVSGCVALLKSFHPDWTAAQLKQRLCESADDIEAPGHDDQTGWGRVNIWRAIFGSEPNASNYDVNGHLAIPVDNTWQFDNIYDVSTSADYDYEDIFVVQADNDGVLFVDLDIITTGEDLDLEVYDSPDLGVPIGSSIGANNYLRPLEQLSVQALAGEKYYIRVFSPAPYNCSNYRLRTHTEEFIWWLEWQSLAPKYVFNGSDAVPLLKLKIFTNQSIVIGALRPYVTGDVPLNLINNFRLYKDTNGSGSWEDGADDLVAIADPAYAGVNQMLFAADILGISSLGNPLTYFIIADVGPTSLGYNVKFGAGLRTYKDIDVTPKPKLYNDPFPILSNLVVLGEDHVPPVWDTTIGVQHIYEGYQSVTLYWNNATDVLSEPTGYNLYWDENDPPSIATANVINDTPFWDGGDYDHAGQVPGLENDKTYSFLVRAEDASGNEEKNLVWMKGTPNGSSDPENPQVIGELNLDGNATDVWAHGKIAYVANGTNLAIVDCHIPTAPSLIATYPASSCNGVQYHTGQDYVYASSSSGLLIIDPDAPGGPTLVGSYTGSYADDVYVDGNTCYITSGGTLTVLDVTNPASPQYEGQTSLGWFYTFSSIAAKNGYAFGAYSAGLAIIDATNPASPQVINTVSLFWADYDVALYGDYAFVANFFSMLFIVDISDPPNAFEAGSLVVPSGNGYAVAVRDPQYAYFGTTPSTIYSVKWSDLGNITTPGSCETDGTQALFFDGEYLYSAEGYSGLKVLL